MFVGTIRDNLALVLDDVESDARLRGALAAVDALEWVELLPERAGHGRRIGRSPADAGAGAADRAWPDSCWPTRTRWCSTRRPR